MSTLQKITPFLWFDDNAEAAMEFYVSIFPDSRLVGVSRYGSAGPGPEGRVMVGNFILAGQSFVALNGGPLFKFNESISFVVNCATQDEVDEYWSRLGDGGEERQCGWLRDRFGLFWQIVPEVLPRLMQDADPLKVQRVMAAMLQMTKMDIAGLQRAHRGEQ